ncbi:laminin subunit beta-1-like [Iris pallida]|uniref:Laminin subunit beta-1-like n=1 Tax=Iris pallida TaxID=29817 RepID=A0AAX6EXX3_IRIPA|nr:laminin subunit beta-1-like [Iris pallida]
MGYEAVFLSLQETFPQVDSRVLRAVAYEHSKDVDAAAEFVLSEVLTSMRGPSEVIVRRRVNSSEQLAYGTELVCLDENDLPVTQATRSGLVVNIDLLEDFVTNARSNKQTLVSSMETVISMVQESEVLEERAKQAKEEASRAGQATLAKVEELKQILKHAKQANDMHAGDIHGEKAILSTEARELQSRLLSFSDEKERSFSIIEEIRQTLEARLAASQDEIAAAEQEKLEMEGLAQKALKEQELVMEMVVEKSKQLQQEAEENAKLREFLMDRGQVVDTLQGELAVVFEDVMLLKERVEGRLPLSRSLLRAYSSSLSPTSSSQRSISLSNNVLDGLDLGESPRAKG